MEDYGIKDKSLIDVIDVFDNIAEIDNPITILFLYKVERKTINATKGMTLAELYLKFYDTLPHRIKFYYNSIEVGSHAYDKTLDELWG